MKITQQGSPQDRDYIRKKVIEHNLAQLPDEVKHPVKHVSFMLHDDEGEILGGITGTIFWYCLHIDFLWVESSLRRKGYGKALLDHIEKTAKENSCRRIQLDTFSFQAPGFYQKNGYEVVGVVEGHPTEAHQQYYLTKKLVY